MQARLCSTPDHHGARGTARRAASRAAKLARGIALAGVACIAAGSPAAGAAEYPNKPLRIIVPFPPGGTTDVLARLLAPKLTDALKQPVVIDNRAGASGMIGAEAIARAPADGHTFGIIISLHAISTVLFAKSTIDPARDFAPITLGIAVANVISVHPALPATTLPALIKLAKAQPGKLSFGSAGNGTAVHLTGELFKSAARVDIVHIPYKGGGPALADLIAGQIPMGVQNVSTIVPYVRAGKIRALGISGLERSPALPDVPTVASQGLPGFEAKEWYGMVAPRQTPRDIVLKLNQELVRGMNQPDVRARLLDLGAEVAGDTPDHFEAFMKAELTKWSKLIYAAGIRLE